MVTIDKESHTITIQFFGNEDDYLSYCRALAHAIACQDKDLMNHDTVYYVSSLLGNMLPDENQNIKIDN